VGQSVDGKDGANENANLPGKGKAFSSDPSRSDPSPNVADLFAKQALIMKEQESQNRKPDEDDESLYEALYQEVDPNALLEEEKSNLEEGEEAGEDALNLLIAQDEYPEAPKTSKRPREEDEPLQGDGKRLCQECYS